MALLITSLLLRVKELPSKALSFFKPLRADFSYNSCTSALKNTSQQSIANMLFPERGPSFVFALHTLVAMLLRADASLAARHAMGAARDSFGATFATAVRAADSGGSWRAAQSC